MTHELGHPRFPSLTEQLNSRLTTLRAVSVSGKSDLRASLPGNEPLHALQRTVRARLVPLGDRASWSLAAIDGAFVFSALATALVVLIAVMLPARTGQLFNTPDETTNHLFTRTFAQTGKLWYTTDYLSLDDENLLHPRGVLKHEDRNVSYQYPTLPIVYGSVYWAVGENVKYIGAVFALLTLFFMYKTAKLLFDTEYWQVVAVFLSLTPLLFHFARPYLAAGPALTFVSGGVWLLTRYFKQSERRDLAFASAFFVVGMLFRYEFALFSTLLVLAVLWHKHGQVHDQDFRRDCKTYLVLVGALFVVPVLILNTIIYGSPLTYGYSIFNSVYLPDRGAHEGASLIENIGRSALEVLLPQSLPNPGVLLRNVVRFTIGLQPVVAILAVFGGVGAFRRSKVALRYLLPYGLVLVYIVLYTSSSDTWNATTKFVTFNASFVRYWLVGSMVMGFLALYALRLLEDRSLQLALCVFLALYGAGSVLTLGEGSLTDVETAVHRYENWAEEVIVPNTEENAFVYTSRVDKGIVPYRNVAAWWGDKYDRAAVASSMSRVFSAGYPVYVYRERGFSIVDLNEALAPYDLHAIETAGPALYHVVKFDHRRPEAMSGTSSER